MTISKVSKNCVCKMVSFEEAIDAGEVKFVASTISPDRVNDSVSPSGGKIRTKVHLLYGHNTSDINQLLGTVTEAYNDGSNYYLKARFNSTPNGQLARELIKAGDIDQFSISFMPEEWRPNEKGGVDFTSWELLEVSLVPNPAHRETGVIGIKSTDTMVAEDTDIEPEAEVEVEAQAETETKAEPEDILEVDDEVEPLEFNETEDEDEFDLEQDVDTLQLSKIIQDNADAIADAVIECLESYMQQKSKKKSEVR